MAANFDLVWVVKKKKKKRKKRKKKKEKRKKKEDFPYRMFLVITLMLSLVSFDGHLALFSRPIEEKIDKR